MQVTRYIEGYFKRHDSHLSSVIAGMREDIGQRFNLGRRKMSELSGKWHNDRLLRKPSVLGFGERVRQKSFDVV